VPTQAPDGGGWGVVRLDRGRDDQIVFQADVKDRTELIPGRRAKLRGGRRLDSLQRPSAAATPRQG